MTTTRTGHVMYALAVGALAAAIVASAVHAQATNFKAKRDELRRQAAAAREQAQLSGSGNRPKLYALYPTPEITLARPVSVAPGAIGTVSITGKFSEKTVFLSSSDALELSKVAVAPGSFKATVSASADAPPGWVQIFAFAPVSGASAETAAVFIGAPQAFSLTGKNGWTIDLAPAATAFTLRSRDASAAYTVAFVKRGETAPFGTTKGTLKIGADSTPGEYLFNLSPSVKGSALADVNCQTINLTLRGERASAFMYCFGKTVESSIALTGTVVKSK